MWCLQGYLFPFFQVCFVYTIFRTILAALHFNWNLNRETLKDADGNAKLRVTYPKFKEGEGTVREACIKPNYGMLFCLDLFLTHKSYIKITFCCCCLRSATFFVQ